MYPTIQHAHRYITFDIWITFLVKTYLTGEILHDVTFMIKCGNLPYASSECVCEDLCLGGYHNVPSSVDQVGREGNLGKQRHVNVCFVHGPI